MCCRTYSRLWFKSALDLIELLKEKDGNNPRLLENEVKEYIRQKNWEKAYEIAQDLIFLESSEATKLNYVSICIELGKAEEAFSIAEQLYKSNPVNEDIQLAYIKSLIANNKNNEALSIIASSLESASSKMKSALYYQRSRLENSEDKKLSSLRSSLTANPRNEEALFALYELYFNKNDYRKAQYYLKQVIALNPSNQELLEINANLENYLY